MFQATHTPTAAYVPPQPKVVLVKPDQPSFLVRLLQSLFPTCVFIFILYCFFSSAPASQLQVPSEEEFLAVDESAVKRFETFFNSLLIATAWLRVGYVIVVNCIIFAILGSLLYHYLSSGEDTTCLVGNDGIIITTTDADVVTVSESV